MNKREELNRAVEEFLKAGGKIEQVPAKQEVKRVQKKAQVTENPQAATYRLFINELHG